MQNKLISSVQNSKIKYLKQVANFKYSNLFLVEGYHLVQEAFKNNLVIETFELNENQLVYPNSILITSNVLSSITNTKTPEGIVALCKITFKTELNDKIIFLDNVQDPGNIGTIIRTMKAFNFNSLIANINLLNHKIIRSTQGAIFNLNYYQYKQNDYSIIKKLKSEGYKIIGTLLDKNSQPYFKNDLFTGKFVLIMGNEGNGISRELQQLLDYSVYIPINFESLNVAVATGIVLNHIYQSEKK
ncbi:TrmH family RNA methyltransferase [Mycoplasmopsis gallinarum]